MGKLKTDQILKENKLAKRLTGGTGAVAAFTARDVQVRQEDEQIITDLINSSPEAAAALKKLEENPENLEALGRLERAILKTARVIDNNIPDWARKASKQLEINPNDSKAQKILKQYTDSLLLTGTGSAILSLPLLLLKYGAQGASQILSSTSKKMVDRNRAVVDGGLDTPAPSPNASVRESTLEVAEDGSVKQRNVIVEQLARINTKAGRLLAARAALPQRLYEGVIERTNAAKDFNLRIKKQIIDLQQSVKKNNDSEEALSVFVNTGKGGEDLSEETVNLVGGISRLIKSNEAEINGLLGLKGKNKIGLGHGPDGFYLTRFYEASNNPSYLKKIRKALDSKGSDIDFIRKVENARSYFREKGVEANQIDGLIESMVLRLSKEDRGLLDNIFEGHGSQLDKSLKVLKERQKLDDPILDLLGEVKDPYKKLATTLKQQNKLISEISFLKQVDDFAKESVGKAVELPGLFPVLPSVRTTFKQKGPGRGLTTNLEETAKASLGKFGSNRTKVFRNIYTSPAMGKYINNGLDLIQNR